MVIILMGVAGAGKTTIGERLASELTWPFYDGDDLHPQANVEKMARGIPLMDADRAPWLAAIRALIATLQRDGQPAVIACSALKAAYRSDLAAGDADVRFVYLKAEPAMLRDRLGRRQGHYCPVELLDSQLATLEEPEDALVVDAAQQPEAIVVTIRKAISLK